MNAYDAIEELLKVAGLLEFTGAIYATTEKQRHQDFETCAMIVRSCARGIAEKREAELLAK